MHLDLLLVSFSVQTIFVKYLYCSEVKNKQTNKTLKKNLFYNSFGFDFGEGGLFLSSPQGDKLAWNGFAL